MSVNVVFSNQKGGVGKTTSAMLFANYLVLSEKMDVVCFDFDPQHSFYEKHQDDITSFQKEPLYDVNKFDLEDADKVIELVNQYDGVTVFDLPGNLNDNNMVPLLVNADVIICPFHYDKMSLDSTLVFAQVVQHLNQEMDAQIDLYFLPNRINRSVNYDSENLKDSGSTKQKIDQVLVEYGTVLDYFPDLVSFQRLDVFHIPNKLNYYVRRTFEGIHKKHLSK